MPDTNPSVADPRELIDHEMIAKANADRDATLAAHREAERAVTAAESSVRAANSAADAAIATGGDALTAERTVADAELNLRAARRRLSAAAQAVADAPQLHRQAVGEAHAAAARQTARQTLEQHRVAAEAKATIAAAERRVQELQIMINGFAAQGAHGLRDVVNRPGLIRDLATEEKLFASLGFDFSGDAQ